MQKVINACSSSSGDRVCGVMGNFVSPVLFQEAISPDFLLLLLGSMLEVYIAYKTFNQRSYLGVPDFDMMNLCRI